MLPGEDGAGDGVVGHGERRGRRAVDADHDLVVPDNEAVEQNQKRMLCAAHTVGRRGRRNGNGFASVYGDRDRGEVYARHRVDAQ